MNYRSQCALTATLIRMSATHIPLVFVLCTLPGGGWGYSVQEYADHFARFLRTLRLSGSMPEFGLRVWERHLSGGWHAHFVVPKCSLPAIKVAWAAVEGGLVFSRDVDPDMRKLSTYLAGELTKWRQRDMSDQVRRVRTWAAWGETHCPQSDIRVESQLTSLMLSWRPLRPRSAIWQRPRPATPIITIFFIVFYLPLFSVKQISPEELPQDQLICTP